MNVIMRQVKHDLQRGMMAYDGAIPLGEYISSDTLSKPDPSEKLMMIMT